MLDGPSESEAEAVRRLTVQRRARQPRRQREGHHGHELRERGREVGDGCEPRGRHGPLGTPSCPRRPRFAKAGRRSPDGNRVSRRADGCCDRARRARSRARSCAARLGGADQARKQDSRAKSRRSGVRGPGRRGTAVGLPAGFLPASPGELVGTRAVANILDELREGADFVLVDAPPLLAVSDALTLSTRVDALLVVVRLGVVDRPMLRELHRQLDVSPARKLGFVLAGGAPMRDMGITARRQGRTMRTTRSVRCRLPSFASRTPFKPRPRVSRPLAGPEASNR